MKFIEGNEAPDFQDDEIVYMGGSDISKLKNGNENSKLKIESNFNTKSNENLQNHIHYDKIDFENNEKQN